MESLRELFIVAHLVAIDEGALMLDELDKICDGVTLRVESEIL